MPNSKRSQQAAEDEIKARIAGIEAAEQIASMNSHTTGTSRPTAQSRAREDPGIFLFQISF